MEIQLDWIRDSLLNHEVNEIENVFKIYFELLKKNTTYTYFKYFFLEPIPQTPCNYAMDHGPLFEEHCCKLITLTPFSVIFNPSSCHKNEPIFGQSGTIIMFSDRAGKINNYDHKFRIELDKWITVYPTAYPVVSKYDWAQDIFGGLFLLFSLL